MLGNERLATNGGNVASRSSSVNELVYWFKKNNSGLLASGARWRDGRGLERQEI
jgi:hypothetical protein